MKKLIAMMAAVCALGAYAEEWAGKQFSDFENGEVGEWVTESQDTTLEVKTYGDGEALTDAGSKYLYVETDKNDAAVKEIGGDQTGLNVYVDTLVKFTPFDKEPTIDEDAKIAVWYLEKDAEGEEGQEGYVPAQTNLMVTAGLLNGAGDATQTSVALIIPDDFDANAWHQLKIASYGNIVKKGDPRLGFTIELDENPVEVAEGDSFILAGDVELVDEVYANMKTTIFPAFTKDTTIASFAIKGSGSIDNLTINATAVVVEVDVKLPESEKWVADSETTKAVPGAEIDLTLYAQDGYRFVGGKTEVAVKGTVGTDGAVTITNEPKTEAAVAMIGEDYFFTLEEAFDAIPEETGETELDIIVDCQYGEDGFELKAEDVLVVVGTIAVDKDGIKLMTENTTLLVDGEFDLVTSGVDGFEAKYDEDEQTWYLEEAEPTEVLPTATVEKSEAEGYEAVVKFTALEQGSGYDNWAAKFILTSNVEIGNDEIKLGGSYGEYGWLDLDFSGCEADEKIDVLALGNITGVVVKDLYTLVREFSCGVKNLGLKEDTTFTLKLVITDPEGVKEDIELCKIENLTVEKKATEPKVVPEEQGTVEFVGEGDNRIAKVTPKEGVTEITVNAPIGFMGKYEIPVSITKITGVKINQLIIKSGEYDIAPACKIAEGGAIELDEAATVKVGEEQIPVKPVLSEATDAVKPLVVGETTAVGVKTIPGLKYSLVRSETIGGEQKAVASETATGARLELVDEFKEELGGKPASAFYVIQVTK